VYEAGNGRVLRRYHDARPAAKVTREAEVMRYARAHGVPAPEVFDVSGRDILMERAVGPTMLDALGRRLWTAGSQARLLARLHAQMHAVAAPDWLHTAVARRLRDPNLLPSERDRLRRQGPMDDPLSRS
jgi:aminoglycoside phosphotransferase